MTITEEPTVLANVGLVARHGGDISIEITQWRGSRRCRLTHRKGDGSPRYNVALSAEHVDELIAVLAEARRQL